MKPILAYVLGGLLLAGCASPEAPRGGYAGRVTTGTDLNDQPQTALAGDGSLMPGAHETRTMPTGQFTGWERTNDQIGQRPALPPEADAREQARDE